MCAQDKPTSLQGFGPGMLIKGLTCRDSVIAGILWQHVSRRGCVWPLGVATLTRGDDACIAADCDDERRDKEPDSNYCEPKRHAGQSAACGHGAIMQEPM
jgi:hypothetical protein